MNLRLQAELDLSFILEDATNGFGWPATITDPSGKTDSFVVQSNDISQIIDPDTGQAVSGRSASASVRISTLTAKGFALPQGIADSGSKPWIIEFDDISLNPFKFKVAQSNPDRTLGIVSCLLELYK